VGVGEVDAGRVDLDLDRAVGADRLGQLDELEHLGPTEPRHLDRSHSRTLW
jgi:hypothetical protein